MYDNEVTEVQQFSESQAIEHGEFMYAVASMQAKGLVSDKYNK